MRHFAQCTALHRGLLAETRRKTLPRLGKTVHVDPQALHHFLTKAQWSVAELRVFDGGRELPRDPEWRLSAHPNPWDVQLAFDNSAVTRWRSWQPAEPGMFLEIDLARSQKLDSVIVESSGDSSGTKIKLEALADDGKWTTIAAAPNESYRPSHVSLRQAATAEIKSRGIRYVLITDDNIGANDFRSYSKLWGMKSIAQQGMLRLYYIE